MCHECTSTTAVVHECAQGSKHVDEQVLHLFYYTTNAGDKRSIPKQNDKQNRLAFDHGNQVPVHSAQQNLIRGVYVQNFNTIKVKLP